MNPPIKPPSLFLLLCFVQIACSAVHSHRQAKVAFVLYDAGETRALEPVLDQLKERKISALVVAGATSRELISSRSEFIDMNLDCGVRAEIDRVNWSRQQALSPSDVQKIEMCFDSPLVVTGMVSHFQAQVAEVIQSREGRRVWGYFDGFSRTSVNETPADMISAVDQVLVPSESVAAEFKVRSKGTITKIVGQPSLEKWRAIVQKVDKAELRKKLGLGESSFVILYAGGYGEGYEEAFRLFVRSVKTLSKYQMLVSLHPKVDGEFEREVLREAGENRVQIIPKGISTAEALAVSSVLISHRSSTGVQAVFAGKPAIYLDAERGKYSDLAIENKWAEQVFSETQFRKALRRIGKIRVMNFYRLAGVPSDSVKTIADLIEREVNGVR